MVLFLWPTEECIEYDTRIVTRRINMDNGFSTSIATRIEHMDIG